MGERELKKKAFFLSFDDGLNEISTIIAPLLKQKGVPATFFLCSDFIENRRLFYRNKASILLEYIKEKNEKEIVRKVNPILNIVKMPNSTIKDVINSINYQNSYLLDDIANLIGCNFNSFIKVDEAYLNKYQVDSLIKDGFDIGGHSVNHPLFRELNFEEQYQQVVESIFYLEKQFGIQCKSFAFPFSEVGIDNKLLPTLISQKVIKTAFGTSGFLKRQIHPLVQRISMESYSGSAKDVINYHLYAQFKNYIGTNIFKCLTYEVRI